MFGEGEEIKNRFKKGIMEKISDYISQYLEETKKIADLISKKELSQMVSQLLELKKNQGRLFILGVGGSAANASHAVNDFRKIAGIESYAPTDNVSELTARINDESWEGVFESWLKTSRFTSKDALLVFSVGGGTSSTSRNLVYAMEHGKKEKGKIFSIVSRNGGAAKELSDVCILIPVIDESRITPHAEGWQAVAWHLVVTCLSQLESPLS